MTTTTSSTSGTISSLGVGSGLDSNAIVTKLVALERQPISLLQNEHMNRYRAQDGWLIEHRPDIYMAMLETAEIVAKTYGVTREAQDAFGLQSQQRHAAAERRRPWLRPPQHEAARNRTLLESALARPCAALRWSMPPALPA